MKKLASRFWVFFFFILLSIGQAYPYSVAWAASQAQDCACNAAKRQCLHGCHVKKIPAPPKDHEHHHATGQDSRHAHHTMSATAKHECGSPAKIVSPLCSKHQLETINFRGEPFLLSFQVLMIPVASVIAYPEYFFTVPSFVVHPETPPPKPA